MNYLITSPPPTTPTLSCCDPSWRCCVIVGVDLFAPYVYTLLDGSCWMMGEEKGMVTLTLQLEKTTLW